MSEQIQGDGFAKKLDFPVSPATPTQDRVCCQVASLPRLPIDAKGENPSRAVITFKAGYLFGAGKVQTRLVHEKPPFG
jgi:hypothetical protein